MENQELYDIGMEVLIGTFADRGITLSPDQIETRVDTPEMIRLRAGILSYVGFDMRNNAEQRYNQYMQQVSRTDMDHYPDFLISEGIVPKESVNPDLKWVIVSDHSY
jgi:hypothetical protein|tara:strand:- start:169 stop:489 length:321 start_codon:yes stop_codon:yes gene_type:complete